MKQFDGYKKRTLTDTLVLLAGGGNMSLGDFIGSLQWDSENKKLQYKSASATTWTDLVAFGSNAMSSTSYLPLTGGTITNGSNWAAINFSRTGVGSGTVGGIDANGLYFMHQDSAGTSSISMYLKAGDGLKVGGTKVSLEGHTHSDYLSLSGGTLTGDINFQLAYNINWNDGDWWQRINITDDSSANTPVFTFQLSNGTAGSSWNTLLTIYDNGNLVVPAELLSASINVNDSSGYTKVYPGYVQIRKNSPANPTANYASIEFSYNSNPSQPIYIGYTPNDGYRIPAGLKIWGGTGATPAWFEVEGEIYASGGYTVLHSNNSSVSKSGETLSVKINGTTQSLTNTWRNITDSYNPTEASTTISLSLKGAKDLYTALYNGPADTIDGYHGSYFIPKFTFMQKPGYWYIPAIGSRVTSEDTDDWWGVHGKVEVKLGDTFWIKGHGGSDPDLWAWADTSDIIRLISGDQVHYTSFLEITAPQDGYLYYSFNKLYEHQIIPKSWLPGFLTEANYNSYTPTLTGTGASGTWGINITGSANYLSSWALASSESTWRYVWMSHNDNSGKAAYYPNLMYLTSTSTLKSTYFEGTLKGSSQRLALTSILSLSSFTHSTDLIYAAAGGDNSVSDKPSGVDAFGVLSFKDADGWYMQILGASNLETGIYYRTGTSFSGGWRKLIDSSNIGSLSVSNADTVDSYHGYEFIRKDTNITISFNDNLWLNTGDYSSIGSVTTQSNWKYVKLSVKKGDKFLIKGDGGSSPRLWAFADTSNVIKLRANDQENRASYTEITAGQDGYLVVNFDKNEAPEGDLIPISWASGFLTRASISPSLSISGNTIATNVGGITSDYITVPYATSSGSAYTVSSWAQVGGGPARYIWMSHSDNSSKAGYDPSVTYNPDTGIFTTYNLSASHYVYAGTYVQAAQNIIPGDGYGLLWNSGSWWQRLTANDTSDTSQWIFKFLQSEGTSGSSWVDYFTIYKNAAYIGSNVVYHAGNLPAYPTKSSWNYDDRYLKIFSLDSYNVDTIYNSGLYELYGATNTPAAAYGVLLCMGYRKHTGNTSTDYCTQIYMPAGNSATSPNGLFYRTSEGSWHNWLEVLTVQNWTSHISLPEYYPKASWTKKVGYWYTPAVNSKHTSYNSSDTYWISYKYRVKSGDSFLIKGRGGYDPDLYAFTDTNEVVKSISGDGVCWEGEYHTITAGQDGYLYVNFNARYAYGLIPISWTPWYLTEGNYTDYTVTKTGGGASGTWSINITGSADSASSAYTVSSFAEANGSEDRYIWMSHSTNNGNAAYKSSIMFNPNAGTLKVTNVSSTGTWYIGNSSGDYVNIGPGYINIRKYSPVNPTANLGTISFDYYGGQTVYIAYTPNDSYRASKGIKIFGDSSDNGNCWLEVLNNVYAANFYTTSDRNKKQNISSFSEHIRKFQLKDTEKWHYGVVAQEVEEMFREGEEGNMTVNYNSVLSYYIGLLENKIKQLEEKINILENK